MTGLLTSARSNGVIIGDTKMTEANAVKAVVRAMDEAFQITSSMELSERQETKTGVKENVKVGDSVVSYPSLEDFGIEAIHDVKGEAARKMGDTLPIYEDPRMQWLFDSVVVRVQAIARSKFLKGKLRDGAEVPVDFNTLLEKGERGGEFLKIKAEAKASFTKYLEAAGKSAQVQTVFVSLFINPESLVTCEAKFADALMSHLGKWIQTLADGDASRFAKIIAKVQESYELRSAGLDLS
jgi:hypothetical protein